MIVKDFSPKHENKYGYFTHMAFLCENEKEFFLVAGIGLTIFKAHTFGGFSFQDAKAYLPKNSKVYIDLSFNSITGKYEMHYCNKKYIDSTKSYIDWGYIGKFKEVKDLIA